MFFTRKYRQLVGRTIPNNRKCSECRYASYHSGSSILASGFECNLNPKRPIAMGLRGQHSDR